MGRMKQVTFTPAEKSELQEKSQKHFLAAGIEAMIAVGSSNITYLSGGIVFPYLDQKLVHPVALYHNFISQRQILVCTFDLSDIPAQLGWQGEVVVYELTEATPERSLAVALGQVLGDEDLTSKTIGFDDGQMSRGQFLALQEALLGNGQTAVSLTPASHILRELRLQKTDAEIRLLEISGRMGDRGFISALNHAEGAALDSLSYPIWEYGERFRVHVAEFGGSGVGNLSVLQGERARDLYSPTGTRETFVKNSFIRMEYSLQSYGYWATGARTVYVGKPDEAAERVWADNLILKRVAIEALLVGNKASDVYAAVANASAQKAIPFWQTSDVGHGLGAAEREAPFLAPYDQTELRPGMVVVVAVYTYTAQQELIGNKDIFLITESAPQLLTWYKNWDRLYALHGTSARHG